MYTSKLRDGLQSFCKRSCSFHVLDVLDRVRFLIATLILYIDNNDAVVRLLLNRFTRGVVSDSFSGINTYSAVVVNFHFV